MLVGLSIKDVVLIDQLYLDFQKGFSVLTGETGAGKSILLDSLSLALGMRGDISLIRQGTEQATVTAEFDLKELSPQHPIWELIKSQEWEIESSLLILRRILHKTDRSRAFINEQSVSIRTLKEVGNLILEIHSQFDHLFDAALHQEMLDRFASHTAPSLYPILGKVQQAYQDWKKAQNELVTYQHNYQQSLQQQAFHRQVISDLSSLKLLPNEEDVLLAQRQSLSQYGKISTAVEESLKELFHPLDILAHLVMVQKNLERANSIDSPDLKEIIQALDRANIELQEVQEALRKLHHQDQDSVQALETLDERLHTLRSLAKRYNVPVNELYNFYNHSQTLLDTYEQAEYQLQTYQAKVREALGHYQKICHELTVLRQQAARNLEQAVSLELPDLKLAQAKFVVDLRLCDPTPLGSNKIEFLMAANPGQTPTHLNKAASGGELSRLMLALKVVLTRHGYLSTIVFDEVDTGVGGAIAAAIGQRLAKLAHHVQVLAITHLPQVAAYADHHYKVVKQTSKNANQTTVQALSSEDRVDELARMLAGATITPEARAAAQQLLNSK
jgi:DNA repair protein RecN (Recombination protein N)